MAEAKDTLGEVEADRPEYSSKRLLLNRPAYLNNGQSLSTANDRMQNTKVWLEEYQHVDLRQLQMHKQNHVHARDEDTGRREPLTACRSKDKLNFRKGSFP